MDIAFTRGTGKAPLLLASCVPNLMGGVWRFSLLVGVTDLTARHYGGLAATEVLIRNQIDTINQKFNAPAVFNGQFDFHVSKIYVFTSNVDQECAKGHWGYSFRMVYDAFPSHGGGWMGEYHSIYHSWYVSHLGGPFGGDATDGLTHEFGHSRGAVDLYALEVDGANNPVNGSAYKVTTPSIMYYPYGVNVWDNHSISLINENKKTSAPSISYITKAFPPSFEGSVANNGGQPQAGVDVSFYPVDWYKRAVGAAPVFTVKTDAAGRFRLPSNPFDPGQPGHPWDIRYCNFLVEAKRGTATVYEWLPLDQVQNAYFTNSTTPFVISLTL